ncbi:TorD/DmsD family molecular chaperone [Pseudogemmobacter sp. W21_MBD1_M6]|uniref:TorD/DmsD family molecular chaperone n=1 Tax=Pseudogemmobacter sp. W21_MBD1_M6 TaxID=3240271 RepID=UPI003F9E05F0
MDSALKAADNDAAASAEDLLRADLYNLLAVLISKPPTEGVLAHIQGLTGDSSELGIGVNTLAGLAGKIRPKAVTKEFNALFIGLGRGELLPYASFYMTGFLNEKPLSRLRQDMRKIGITRAENVYEPEDNIASLCEMMAGLIRGEFGAAVTLAEQNDFFRVHIGPWAGHFFSDLEAAKNSVFYAPVGTIGRVFMQIESEAFRLEE